MTDAGDMLEDCVKRYKKLTDWEMRFVDSLLEFNDLADMSDKQYETLEKIWERVT